MALTEENVQMSSPWSPDPVPPLDPGAAPSAPPYAYQPSPPLQGPPPTPGVPGPFGQPMPPPPAMPHKKASRRGPWFYLLGFAAVLALIAAGFGLGKVVSGDDSNGSSSAAGP